MNILYIIGGVIGALVVIAFILSLPGLLRYIKINKM